MLKSFLLMLYIVCCCFTLYVVVLYCLLLFYIACYCFILLVIVLYCLLLFYIACFYFILHVVYCTITFNAACRLIVCCRYAIRDSSFSYEAHKNNEQLLHMNHASEMLEYRRQLETMSSNMD